MNGKKVLAALCVCALAVLSACGQGYADPSGSGSGENVGSVASSGSTGNAWESSAAGSEDSGTEAARRLAERREYISRYRERICAYGAIRRRSPGRRDRAVRLRASPLWSRYLWRLVSERGGCCRPAGRGVSEAESFYEREKDGRLHVFPNAARRVGSPI